MDTDDRVNYVVSKDLVEHGAWWGLFFSAGYVVFFSHPGSTPVSWRLCANVIIQFSLFRVAGHQHIYDISCENLIRTQNSKSHVNHEVSTSFDSSSLRRGSIDPDIRASEVAQQPSTTVPRCGSMDGVKWLVTIWKSLVPGAFASIP